MSIRYQNLDCIMLSQLFFQEATKINFFGSFAVLEELKGILIETNAE